MATRLPLSTAAPPTRKATMTRSPSSRPVARLITTLSLSATRCSFPSNGFDRTARAPPLRVPDVEPACLAAAGPQEADGVVGVDAVRAAAIRDDLAPLRQGGGERLERVEGCGRGARDVTGPVLGPRPHVEEDHVAAGEALLELVGRELLDFAAVSQILVGEDADLGDMAGCDVADRRPQVADPVTREPVVDTGAIAAGAHDPAAGQHLEVLRGVGDALPDLAGELFYRPLALSEHVDDLGAASVA